MKLVARYVDGTLNPLGVSTGTCKLTMKFMRRRCAHEHGLCTKCALYSETLKLEVPGSSTQW